MEANGGHLQSFTYTDCKYDIISPLTSTQYPHQYSYSTRSPPAGTPAPDLLCMVTTCAASTFSCLTDRSCLKALACLQPCGDDQVHRYLHSIYLHSIYIYRVSQKKSGISKIMAITPLKSIRKEKSCCVFRKIQH